MFYAVKTNPDEQIIQLLLKNNCNFDCASEGEIQKALELGVAPEQIIFANPCKSESALFYAKEKGVTMTTFDCEEEAIKIHKIYPEVSLILRLQVTKTDAPYPLYKFGAPEYQWDKILRCCKRLGLKVRGVSFHVGSGGCSFEAY